MAVIANRHGEFLDRGGRVFGVSADTPEMNAAIVDKLALPFPILSDADREKAITPLGFADEKHPDNIARTGSLIVSPAGEVVFTYLGRDYADRPQEEVLLHALGALDLPPASQEPPEIGAIEPGPRAVPLPGIGPYFRGAKFATLALRSRYRDLGDVFADDTKQYVEMVERYLAALPGVEARRG